MAKTKVKETIRTMIPINNLDELVNHCNANNCGNCLLEQICENSNIQIFFNNQSKILPKHDKEKLSAILQEIVKHNRKEKLGKLLSWLPKKNLLGIAKAFYYVAKILVNFIKNVAILEKMERDMLIFITLFMKI